MSPANFLYFIAIMVYACWLPACWGWSKLNSEN
uniref:Uncharacterized protein n=1 Tax=Drosophila melanogaster TaxID=7227 RepID=M9NET3_DROME|nr:uncharacterized protein Dmel_CG43354 [Drosophila melanogaster]AFH03752.1 uncharacterized protein Dmel_CG43354 [Drosophila melanogaster]|eukprot:NP_001246078.1 uncharacterized protein Dmel_CG43354 [Drosophila melanogaster]